MSYSITSQYTQAYRAAPTASHSDRTTAVAETSLATTPVRAVTLENTRNISSTEAFARSEALAYLGVMEDQLRALSEDAPAPFEGNKEFLKNLIDANNRGISQLVDADLNEESAKLKSLQTQEQLAIQALGLANRYSQNILSMFE